ncbi:hypothetical protein B0H13DRAFT_855619 [Mycena leptocephala]|nr:hypothetical protein B0H13DRAFT_855619 [Mycena leptocephala]
MCLLLLNLLWDVRLGGVRMMMRRPRLAKQQSRIVADQVRVNVSLSGVLPPLHLHLSPSPHLARIAGIAGYRGSVNIICGRRARDGVCCLCERYLCRIEYGALAASSKPPQRAARLRLRFPGPLHTNTPHRRIGRPPTRVRCYDPHPGPHRRGYGLLDSTFTSDAVNITLIPPLAARRRGGAYAGPASDRSPPAPRSWSCAAPLPHDRPPAYRLGSSFRSAAPCPRSLPAST